MCCETHKEIGKEVEALETYSIIRTGGVKEGVKPQTVDEKINNNNNKNYFMRAKRKCIPMFLQKR
jgi:hypothetical protein